MNDKLAARDAARNRLEEAIAELETAREEERRASSAECEAMNRKHRATKAYEATLAEWNALLPRADR